jgi:hypothetical protein
MDGKSGSTEPAANPPAAAKAVIVVRALLTRQDIMKLSVSQ